MGWTSIALILQQSFIIHTVRVPETERNKQPRHTQAQKEPVMRLSHIRMILGSFHAFSVVQSVVHKTNQKSTSSWRNSFQGNGLVLASDKTQMVPIPEYVSLL